MSSTVPISSMPPRKSFAEVAAAAHAPINHKDKIQNRGSQSPAPPEASSPLIVSSDSVAVSLSEETPQILAQDHYDGPKPLDGATLNAHNHELPAQTQASSIESFSRRDNSDTKSVTSRTTLTLDEKESLRPDDSASVQAAVEDDRPSPAGSRLGTNNSEARAFSDQLHEIERSDQPLDPAQRGMPHIVFPLPRNPSGGIMYATSPAPVSHQQPVIIDPSQFRAAPGTLTLPPDEKLMEALASPKDRLFVLKVEQDIIDFVKDSKDNVLILPQTNSFYRMLSHKLADYYCLDHAVDESMQSVRISRTPHCRLPVSLISMSTGTEGPTPPPSAPARVIMRRNEGYQSSGLNTENPSMTTSEAGLMSGSEDGPGTPAKDKSQMTREERESRYNEARARIFSDWKRGSSENGDSSSAQNDLENSRSSSPSRAKKGASGSAKKKQPKDDSFEPRSTFNALPNQPFVSNSMQQQISNMAMFNAFPGLNVSGPYQASSSQPQSPSQYDDPSMTPQLQQQHPQYMQQQGQWYPQPQQYPMGYNMMSYSHQGQPQFGEMSQGGAAYNGYNPYGSPQMGAQTTPKPGNVAPAVYQSGQSYPNQMASPMWQRPAGSYPSPNPNSYNIPGYGGYPTQSFQPPQSQQPPATYHEAQAWNMFQGQQFNPMSQSFVPSFGQQASPNAPRFGASPAVLQRQMSNHSHVSGPLKGTRSGPQSPRPKDINNGSSSSSPGMIPPQQSSISKWANSTSLPSKPPAPKPDKPSVPPNPMTKPS